jgi:hypothetical protein
VVDSGGQVLFAGDLDATLEPYLQRDDVTARAVDRGRNGQSGVYRGGYKSRESGVRYAQAYAPVAETDWIVITRIDLLHSDPTRRRTALLGCIRPTKKSEPFSIFRRAKTTWQTIRAAARGGHGEST